MKDFENIKETFVSDTNRCYHCGDDNTDLSIHIEEKYFCCQGCKMVFEILNENDMCKYYEIDENAAFSLKGKRKSEYGWLDDLEIVEQLIDFADGATTKVSFFLPQIHCSSCIWLLENLYKLNDGVSSSKVNFLKKQIYITFDTEKTNFRKIVELLDSIGYPPELNYNNISEKKNQTTSDKSFFYKLGLAGFAFGNIMLMSFPEYLGLDKTSDSFMFNIFGYINILFSIPVVFYSAIDYLKSGWLGIKHKKLNIDVPISIGILSIFIRSVYEIMTQSGAGYLDSLAGLVFFLLIGKWFQKNTYNHLSFDRDYKSYFPISITKRIGNELKPIAISKLDSGDLILIKNEELIPTDGIMTKGQAYIDYSFVTGESKPVSIKIGEKIYAGGRQMGSNIEINVTKKVSQSYLTQLWNDNSFKEQKKSSISNIADVVGERFTFVILIIATATLIYWLMNNPSLALNAFSSVLIIACPCAVALSIPFTFGNTIRILTKHKFFLKNTAVIENIPELDIIVFDKTGTLTDSSRSQINWYGDPLSKDSNSIIKTLTQQSLHPLSRIITNHLKTALIVDTYDYEEKIGLGIKGKVLGKRIQIGSAKYLGISAKEITNSNVYIKIEDKILGYFSISNTYRSSLKNTLQYFTKNYTCYLLSGDSNKNKKEWLDFFDNENHILFEQDPMAKLKFIKELQDKGHKVMMIGDGLNDAGALQQSNVGVVITENVNNFNPSCDAILQGTDFSLLPKFLQYSQGSTRLVYYAYGLAFMYNIVGISFAVQGILSPLIAAILMPLSSVSVVLFGVFSSNLLAKKILNNKYQM